jgi:hypothetical protein
LLKALLEMQNPQTDRQKLSTFSDFFSPKFDALTIRSSVLQPMKASRRNNFTPCQHGQLEAPVGATSQ